MDFDQIRNYWEGRASSDDSAQSTTQDVYLREIELKALSERVGKYRPESVCDIGCGDGRTTAGLATRYESIRFTGYDYSRAMVDNAIKINGHNGNLSFSQLDICDGVPDRYDLIYTTRCLINLPSWELQEQAIYNIHQSLNDGGVYVLIENFVEGQDNFNKVRKDFGLPEIAVRDHNLFFNRQKLLKSINNIFDIDEEVNISSVYYLVSRVIYSKICSDSGQTPDYFDSHHRYAAGLPFAGEFGPVRLICLKKK